MLNEHSFGFTLEKAEVVNVMRRREWTRMRLYVPSDHFRPTPGQFVHVRVSAPKSTDPLLRRPLSVGGWDGKSQILDLFIRPAGRGTRQVLNLDESGQLAFIGPLGNGFPLDCARGRKATIIAGGIGAAPMVFLARELVRNEVPTRVFLGAGKESQLVGVDVFQRLDCELALSTEDGSRGHRGLVTELFNDHLGTSDDARKPVVYTCGPKAMMARVHRITGTRNIPAFGSFEEHMACGVGACLGCAIRMSEAYPGGPYARVCRDGPVFSLKEVDFGE